MRDIRCTAAASSLTSCKLACFQQVKRKSEYRTQLLKLFRSFAKSYECNCLPLAKTPTKPQGSPCPHTHTRRSSTSALRNPWYTRYLRVQLPQTRYTSMHLLSPSPDLRSPSIPPFPLAPPLRTPPTPSLPSTKAQSISDRIHLHIWIFLATSNGFLTGNEEMFME